MSETRTYTYEAMFLFSQATAADFGGAIAHLREILDKAGAQVIAMKKWDERRLAYEIDKQKRGVYILTYFTVSAKNVAQIERSCNLSEKVLRHLITRADHLTLDEMKATDAQKELETEARLRAERGPAVTTTTATKPAEEPAAAGAEDDQG